MDLVLRFPTFTDSYGIHSVVSLLHNIGMVFKYFISLGLALPQVKPSRSKQFMSLRQEHGLTWAHATLDDNAALDLSSCGVR